MKNRDTKNLSLPLNTNLPATVSGINRNSPSRASIKVVLPPAIPTTITAAQFTQKPSSSSQQLQHQPTSAAEAAISSKQGQGSSTQQQQQQLSSFSEQQQPFYDANNYYSIRPSMQQIPEQAAISLFSAGAEQTELTNGSINSSGSGSSSSGNSSVTSAELLSQQEQQLKYGGSSQNRYSSSSLDSGRGSDSVKLNPGSVGNYQHPNHNHPNHPHHYLHHQHNRVSVHSCESIGSTTSSAKDSDPSSSSSLSSSSSTSSSFCCSSASSTSSSSTTPQQQIHPNQQQNLQPISHQYPTILQHPNPHPHQYSSPKPTPQSQLLSTSSSIVSNCDSPSSSSTSSSSTTSCVTPVGDFTVHNTGGGNTPHKNNVFSSTKSNTIYASMMMPSTIIGGRRPPVHLTSSSSSSSSASTSASSSSDMSHPNRNGNGGGGSGSSSSSSSLVAQAGPPTIAEMILHGVSDSEIIHNWLAKIKLGKYERCFVEAGYDMATVARMTPQDLIAIGITDPKARSTFTAEIGKLNFPDGIPTHKPDSLEEWLKLLGLECYHVTLVQQGYATIDRVTELDLEDFEDVGIFKLGHQKKLLLAIKRVKMLSRSAGRSAGGDQEIYGILGGGNESNGSVKEPMEPPNPNIPIHHLYQPVIMQNSGHYQNHQQLQQQFQLQQNFISQQNPLNLPYQDVPIKMFASSKGGGSALNSPSNPELPQPSFDQQHILQNQQLNLQHHQPLHIITSSSSNSPNNVPSALFCTPNSSSKTPNSMRTFSSQLSEGGNVNNSPHQFPQYLPQPNYPCVNGVPVPNAIPYYPPGVHPQPFGAPLANSAVSRGRSLESLDSMTPYANYYHHQQHFPYQQQQSYPANNVPPYYRGGPQQQQQFSYQQQQLSNGELNSVGMQQQQQQNRQTVNYETAANFNFNYGGNVPMASSYEPFDGTTTLNRPKNLLGGRPVAKILASARSSGDLGPNYYDGSYDTASLQSNESSKTTGGFVDKNSSDTLSLSSATSDNSSLYSSVNKTGVSTGGKNKPPPPPPPKRVNSIKKLSGSSSSVPSSPLHQTNSNAFSDQVYSNLMYLNNSNSNVLQQQQQQQQQQPSQNNQIINSSGGSKFYNEDTNSRLTEMSINEDVFASCVKSLTSKFSEAVVSGGGGGGGGGCDQSPNGDGNSTSITPSKIASFSKSAQQQPPSSVPQPNSNTSFSTNHNPNHHTLPMNKEKMNNFLQENGGSCNGPLDSVNVSSSSSTESMPFAADNVGTIRQKSAAFMQSAVMRMGGGTSSTNTTSSSSSSSSATSSPMFARNPQSLPGSAFNSPMSATAAAPGFASSGASSNSAAEFDNGFGQPSGVGGNSNLPNSSNDSRQKNVVDSLEDIEIMLANLKTQLDSI